MAASPVPPPRVPASPRSIDDEDESVRIAVRALGDMRSRALASQSSSSSLGGPTPALSIASASTSPTLASPPLAPEDFAAVDTASPDFVSRVSHLPLVHSALRAYENSKASSRVVKYGAEMMESSVKTISRPVIDRLPVNQLDEFARRQLDRLGYGSPPVSSRQSSYATETPEERDRSPVDGWKNGLQIQDVSMGRRSVERDESAVRDEPPPLLPSSSASASASGSKSSESSRVTSPMTEDGAEQQQVVQRSRWQTIMSEAGGISAALSEESMRRLKYCLQWLQYATNHIDGQILLLREFMEKLQPPEGSPYALNPNAIITPEQMQQLGNVKRDVVDTIRQVVDVVSKYAGGALPEPARARVRGFILHLPQAWANAARRQTTEPPAPTAGPASVARGRGARRSARRTEPISRPTSPNGGPGRTHSRQGSTGGPASTAGSAQAAAQRILTLATESLDMMRGVTGVVKDSLDRADAWVERLRVVGLQRQAQADPRAPPDGRPPPLELDLDLLAHRLPAPAVGSANTSVAGSPVVSSAALSPLLHPAECALLGGGVSTLSLNGGVVNGTLSGKKGMFVEGTEDARGSRTPPRMDVDVDG
ncbi:transcription factor Opi1-domain-containing protein [Vararia minispora EC-137]|uniref:Transcription factor Opi1-domain-containing protein n=1 Tax=Vararia minispora EC-137 TaxID=1314806 RepID=A0ACB8QBS5_9AGAM|nr:transcription factor Opi1-domain-containing protein [Vararia minispora EC-137]